MRLERIIYEKLLNNKFFGRNRKITSVSRNHPDDDVWLTLFPKFRIFHIFDSAITYMMSREWKYSKQRLDQIGLTFEDTQLYIEEEFRRSPYLEHIFRESTHPYQQQLFAWRRHRYFKVDVALKGFESPQYIRDEAQKRTFFDSFVNFYRWQHFVNYNYHSEQTASTYMYNGTRTLLELFMIYGLLSKSAWNRYFFNEERYYSINQVFDDFKSYNNGITKNLNLEDPEHLVEFEKRANQFNEKFPGYYAPEGEKVNMKKIISTIQEIKQEFKFDTITSQDLTVIGMNAKIHNTPFDATTLESEELQGSNNIGTKLPKCAIEKETGILYSSN